MSRKAISHNKENEKNSWMHPLNWIAHNAESILGMDLSLTPHGFVKIHVVFVVLFHRKTNKHKKQPPRKR